MDVSIIASAAAAAFAGGFLPWISAEVAIAGAVLLLPERVLPVLVAACVVAQVAAKSGVYLITRFTPHRLPKRAKRLLGRVQRFRDRRRVLGVAVFSGALVSLPPFYLITLACGVLRVPFVVFALASLAGTAVRYGVVAWAALAIGS